MDTPSGGKEPVVAAAGALLCPSARPDWEHSVIIGVVDARTPVTRVVPLTEPAPVSPDLLALAHPAQPTEVFRFAAPCAEHKCVHFQDSKCSLVSRTVAGLPTASTKLPHCRVRPRCRWWAEEGIPACLRCSQIITDGYPETEAFLRAVTPPRGNKAQT
jgi:hypothetical protein